MNCDFHSIISFHSNANTIKILCPQWLQKTLIYNVSDKNDKYGIMIPKDQMKNPFIESCLQCFMQYLFEIDKSKCKLFEKYGVEINLYGDNAFYNKNSLSENNKEKKMGLGSSAALTVSLIKSLFKFFNLNESDLHNLCQLSHFIAQGKIGSGFDIATALFGSILFRRSTLNIDKSQFQLKLNQLSSMFVDIDKQLITIKNVLDCMEISKLDPVKIPPYLCILMGVPSSSFGSKTPKMVSKVLKWKENNKLESEKLWNNLNLANENIINIFESLWNEYNDDKMTENEYINSMDTFCNKKFNDKDKIHVILNNLRITLKEIREYQKTMSKLSKVEIIPEIMDDIINKSVESSNIIIEGGIPGAGGFDALYIICVGNKEKIMNIIESKWKTLSMEMLYI